MKTFLITFIAVVAALGVVAGGIIWYFKRSIKAAESKPTTVRVEKPACGELAQIIQAPGEIQPRSRVQISARVSARIVELPYQEGDEVIRGNSEADPPTSPSILVRLDSNDLAASLRSAKARYEAQKASIRVAEARISAQQAQIRGTSATLAEAARELQRERQLITTQRISRAEYDQAKRRVDELQAQLEAAIHQSEADEFNLTVMEHNLEAADADIVRASDNLSYTVLTSPIDGVVTRVNAKVGELVMTGTMNNAGTVILEVADLSQMVLMARVSEGDIANVRLGQPCKIHMQAYPEKEFNGAVTTISLTSSSDKEYSKFYKSEILIDKTSEQILSGLSADVDIETSRHCNVLKLPSQAVLGRPIDDIPAAVRDSNPNVDKKKAFATVVFCLKDDKALLTPVTVGPSDITHTIIRSGISATDKVIVGPYKVLESLKHEAKVQDELETSATKKLKKEQETSATKGLKDKSTSAAQDLTTASTTASSGVPAVKDETVTSGTKS